MKMQLFLLKKQPTASEIAKDRLKQALVQDRENCSSGLIETLRADILSVITKHVKFDEGILDIRILNSNDSSKCNDLIVNMLITNFKES